MKGKYHLAIQQTVDGEYVLYPNGRNTCKTD